MQKKVKRFLDVVLAITVAVLVVLVFWIGSGLNVLREDFAAFTESAFTTDNTEPTTVPTTEQTTETTDATVLTTEPTNPTETTDATVPTQSTETTIASTELTTEPTTEGFLLYPFEIPYWCDPNSIWGGKHPIFPEEALIHPDEKGLYVEGKWVTFGNPILETDGFTVSYTVKYTDNWVYLTEKDIPDHWWIFWEENILTGDLILSYSKGYFYFLYGGGVYPTYIQNLIPESKPYILKVINPDEVASIEFNLGGPGLVHYRIRIIIEPD